MTARIAFYCNLMGWPKASSGGVRQWVLAIANELAARGHAVDVLTIAPPQRFRDEPALDPRVGRVVLGPRGRAASRALDRYVSEHPGVRVVAALNAFNLRAARLKRTFGDRVSVTLTQHEHVTGDGQAWRPAWVQSLLRLAIRRNFAWADHVVAVSTAVADDLRDRHGVAPDRLRVIFNPAFVRSMHGPGLAAGTPANEHRRLIVAVGRLHPVKGFDVLLDAFSILRDALPARLLILGEGRSRAVLERQVRRLGLGPDVAMPGRVDDVQGWLSRSDLFVLSSRSEGFGNVLVEAMCAGTRIVSTNCPGGPAEILAQGRYGRLVPAGDPAALAAAMLAALAEGRPSPDALRERAEQFSTQQAVDRFLDMWEGARGQLVSRPP